MSKDYYDILGVEKQATKDDIKKAFRKLAHKYHPDKKDGNEVKFKEISEAYSVLSDTTRRQEYDSYGQTFGGSSGGGFDPRTAGFDPSNMAGFDIGDIFGDIFGGTRSPQTKRGRDISIDIEIDFRDAVFGTERKVLLTKVSTCATCSGSGGSVGTTQETCTTCNGRGSVRETRRSILGTFATVQTCSACNGVGTIPKEKCTDCRGLGVKRAEEEIIVTIPPNINPGEMIRMTGAGEAVTGGVAGDLYIKMHVKPHATFHKEGFNLYTTLDIKLTDALLGSEYRIDTLDNNAITVQIPAGASPEEILRVKGKGVPINGGKRGDLLIKLRIQLPKKLSRKVRHVVEELKAEGI